MAALRLPTANTNPDFFKEENQNEITIYSTLDSLFIGPSEYGGSMPDFFMGIPYTKKKLTIYALNLTIVDEIKIPGGEVAVYCRNLKVNKRQDKKTEIPATINVQQSIEDIHDNADEGKALNAQTDGKIGRDGDDLAKELQKAGKKYGTKGLQAGTITIICDTIELEDEFHVLAKGSEGYPGFKGQAGSKGKSGANENVKLRKETKTVSSGNQVHHVTEYHWNGSTPAQTGGKGGRGGRGGRGGEGGEGGEIKIYYNTCDNHDLIIMDVGGGTTGTPGEGGIGGPGGPGGAKYKNYNGKTGEVTFDKNNRAESGPQGNKGEVALPSLNGGDGVLEQWTEIEFSKLGANFNCVFLQKVLQKIKYWYLFNSPNQMGEEVKFPDKINWEKIGSYLLWITNVLSDYSPQNTTNPPKKDLEYARKQALFQESIQLLLQYQANQTYYGTAPNYIPRTQLKVLKDTFEKNSQSRLDIETAFFQYAAEYEQKKTDSYNREIFQMHLKALAEAYKQAFEEFEEKVNMQALVIRGSKRELDGAINILLNSTEQFKEAITTNFDFSIERLCKAFEMLAFTGMTMAVGKSKVPNPMIAVQAASIIYEGFSSIRDEHGRSLPKAGLFNEFKSYEEDILKNAVNDVMDSQGNFEDGQVRAIMADANQFAKEIDEIKDHISNKEAVKAELEALNDLKNSAIKHGNNLLTYNLYVSNCVDLHKKWEDALKSYEDEINKEQILTPYQASVHSQYALIYQHMMERTFNDLYLINRKYIYTTFNDVLAKISLQEQVDQLWITGDKPSSDLTTLLDKYSKMEEEEIKFFSSQPTIFAPIAKKDYRGIIMLSITDKYNPRLLQEFRDRGKIYFSTLPHWKTPQSYNQLHIGSVKNVYNLRITHIQPRIINASTASGRIEVQVKQKGNSTFEGYPKGAENGPLFSFMHEPINSELAHNTNVISNGDRDSDIVGPEGQLTDEYMDNVGIYADWELKVGQDDFHDDANYELDRSEVEAIDIYFKGFEQVKNID